MTLLKNNQFESEWDLSKIKLEQFKQENVLLKYRLSEMVDNNEGSKFLQMAEYFQNELLITDEKLKKLFNKLDKFSHPHQNYINEKKLSGEIMTDYNKLKKDILQFENKFIILKKEFKEKMFENSNH